MSSSIDLPPSPIQFDRPITMDDIRATSLKFGFQGVKLSSYDDRMAAYASFDGCDSIRRLKDMIEKCIFEVSVLDFIILELFGKKRPRGVGTIYFKNLDSKVDISNLYKYIAFYARGTLVTRLNFESKNRLSLKKAACLLRQRQIVIFQNLLGYLDILENFEKVNDTIERVENSINTDLSNYRWQVERQLITNTNAFSLLKNVYINSVVIQNAPKEDIKESEIVKEDISEMLKKK